MAHWRCHWIRLGSSRHGMGPIRAHVVYVAMVRRVDGGHLAVVEFTSGSEFALVMPLVKSAFWFTCIATQKSEGKVPPLHSNQWE
jgi:hypothetical protein